MWPITQNTRSKWLTSTLKYSLFILMHDWDWHYIKSHTGCWLITFWKVLIHINAQNWSICIDCFNCIKPVKFGPIPSTGSPVACSWRSRCPAADPASAGDTSRWFSPLWTDPPGRDAPPARGERSSARGRSSLSSLGWVSWNTPRKLCRPAPRPEAPPGLRCSGDRRWRPACRSRADRWPRRRQRAVLQPSWRWSLIHRRVSTLWRSGWCYSFIHGRREGWEDCLQHLHSGHTTGGRSVCVLQWMMTSCCFIPPKL